MNLSKIKTYKKKLIILALLMTIDYILTWVGVNEMQVITEANPLMVWLFNLPLIPSILFRALITAIPVGLLLYAGNRGYKGIHKVINICIACNIVVMFIHINWIISTI